MTFSIAARCARTGRFGIAVSSSSPAVAARCAFARANVGAVATQNITDPALGPRTLDLMTAGRSSTEALDKIVETADHIAYRQLTAIDSTGRTATFSGGETLGTYATAEGDQGVAAGNLLKEETVPSAMIEAFVASVDADLGDRLLLAMRAALDAGGEEGPVHSAGMLIVDQLSWPVASLRVDWSEDDPIQALAHIWHVYKPQMDAYVTRAIDPSAAPTYGVAGDR